MDSHFSYIERKYSVYFAALLSKDNNNEKLISLLAEGMPSDEWNAVGFAYLGPLEAAGLVDAKLQKCECKSTWIDKIVSAITVKENGVYDLALFGMKLFGEKKEQAGLSVSKEAVDAIVSYLENGLKGREKELILSLRNKDKDGRLLPITPHKKYRFGIINPWPGAKSAESEVVSRTLVAAEDAGIEGVPLSNFGEILDKQTQKATKEFARADDLDFVITTHYETTKILDNFHYHTLWNPPEIPLNLVDYATRITGNYLMNDDYLIYDTGGMSNHLKCMLMNKPRSIKNASSLTASFPESRMLKPQLNDPKMFYCGMNWESVVHNTNRHQGLFKLLDETGKVKFFGPDKVKEWGGVRPWAGYKCYQYSIPFDGFSILKEINECGICLVLSSDIHRRAGSATNRTYEACAAGAVIISDDNPFMLKYFKDAALFITYNKKDPNDTFQQLMEKYKWITEHREEALAMAERAQQIFRERFTMDQQLLHIVQHHPDRVNTIIQDLYARDENQLVAVGYVLNSITMNEAREPLDRVLENIRRQHYGNIELLIAAEESLASEVEEYCHSRYYAVHVFPMKLFDSKKSRFLTNCQALEEMYAQVPHDLFMNTCEHEKWFSDHVTTLVRTLEDEGGEAAYSGRSQICTDGLIRPEFFDNIQAKMTLLDMRYPMWMPFPGQAIFKASCHTYIPEYMRQFLDGFEHVALLAASWILHEQIPHFSKRMTYQYYSMTSKRNGLCTVMPMEYQQRLICDMVHYAESKGVKDLDSNVSTMESIAHGIAWLPVKKWFSMRFCRAFTRIGSLPEGMQLKIHEKYRKAEEEYYTECDETLQIRM